MTPRFRITDEEIVDAIREAETNRETDALEDGVPLPTVHDRIEVDEGWLYRRLEALVRDDSLEKVWGVNPETGHPRESYCVSIDR